MALLRRAAAVQAFDVPVDAHCFHPMQEGAPDAEGDIRTEGGDDGIDGVLEDVLRAVEKNSPSFGKRPGREVADSHIGRIRFCEPI